MWNKVGLLQCKYYYTNEFNTNTFYATPTLTSALAHSVREYASRDEGWVVESVPRQIVNGGSDSFTAISVSVTGNQS